MKVAIFLKNNKVKAFNDSNIDILIFQLKDNQVVGVETLTPKGNHRSERMQMMKYKGVNAIYLLEIEDKYMKCLQKHNIKIITGEQLANDKLFNTLYFSNISKEPLDV